MVVKFKVGQDDYPKKFLEVFNGLFKLTGAELDLAGAILQKYLEYKSVGLKEPFLSKLVFSLEERKKIRDSLSNCSAQNLSNRLDQLKRKGVLVDAGDNLALNQEIVPVNEVTFLFEVSEQPK